MVGGRLGFWHLPGMAVSSPALFPPVLIAWSGLPPVTDEAIASAVSARLPALAEGFGRRVTVFASLLACAMTHRALLSDDDVSVFVGPYLELCPEIGRLLAPIAYIIASNRVML